MELLGTVKTHLENIVDPGWTVLALWLRVVGVSGSTSPLLGYQKFPSVFSQVNSGVVDLSNFDTDPRIRCTTNLLIRIRSGTCFFRPWQQKRSHKIVEIKVFLTFFACWWRDPDPHKIITDPGGPKSYGYSGSGSTTLVNSEPKTNSQFMK